MWKHLNKRTTWSCLLTSAQLGVVLWRACSHWASSIFFYSVENPQGLFHSLLVTPHLMIRKPLKNWDLMGAGAHPHVWDRGKTPKDNVAPFANLVQLQMCTDIPWPTQKVQIVTLLYFCVHFNTSVSKWGSVFTLNISGDDLPFCMIRI